MGQGFLGELELLVMLAVLQAGEGAYAVSIRKELERRTGRRLSRGTVYVTLNRLEEKGFLSSAKGEPTAARGGKAKRIFRVEPEGRVAIEASRSMIREMSRGLDLAREER